MLRRPCTGERHAPDRLVENVLEVALCQSGALEVLDRTDLLCDRDRLLVLDRGHLLLAQAFTGGLVVTEIEFGADEDDGDAGRVMVDLGKPLKTVIITGSSRFETLMSCVLYLGLDVVERGRADDGKAYQEDVGLGV